MDYNIYYFYYVIYIQTKEKKARKDTRIPSTIKISYWKKSSKAKTNKRKKEDSGINLIDIFLYAAKVKKTINEGIYRNN